MLSSKPFILRHLCLIGGASPSEDLGQIASLDRSRGDFAPGMAAMAASPPIETVMPHDKSARHDPADEVIFG
jgi:hypothetical protein